MKVVLSKRQEIQSDWWWVGVCGLVLRDGLYMVQYGTR